MAGTKSLQPESQLLSDIVTPRLRKTHKTIRCRFTTSINRRRLSITTESTTTPAGLRQALTVIRGAVRSLEVQHPLDPLTRIREVLLDFRPLHSLTDNHPTAQKDWILSHEAMSLVVSKPQLSDQKTSSLTLNRRVDATNAPYTTCHTPANSTRLAKRSHANSQGHFVCCTPLPFEPHISRPPADTERNRTRNGLHLQLARPSSFLSKALECKRCTNGEAAAHRMTSTSWRVIPVTRINSFRHRNRPFLYEKRKIRKSNASQTVVLVVLPLCARQLLLHEPI